MNDLFDEFTPEEIGSSSIFDEDFKDADGGKEIDIDRESGATADIFSSPSKKKEDVRVPRPTPVEKPAEKQVEKPTVSAVDKFKAAAERSNVKHEEKVETSESTGRKSIQPTNQAGRRVIQPKSTTVREDISLKDAVNNVAKDVSQKQSNNRQKQQQEARQATQGQRQAHVEQRQQHGPQQRQQQRQAAARQEYAEQRQQGQRQQDQRQATQGQRQQGQRQARVEQRHQGQRQATQGQRQVPKRPIQKKAQLNYKVVGEIESSRPGGGAGFFKRFIVGSLNSIKCVGIERKFKNAKEFKCKPFKFKVYNGEAMIMSYSGDSRVVEFPSYIRAKSGERIPVCYIHSNCLYNNFLNNYKTKNAIENLTSVESSFKLDGKNRIIEIKLPEGLKAIFDNTFDNCTDISSLTIPSTVQFIGNKAFRGSTITKLFFNGEPISNWTADLFPDMNIYVKEEYADLY